MAFQGIKYLTRLYLCHLNYHKFGHNFQDLMNPICRSGHDIDEIKSHLGHYISERRSVVKKGNNLDSNIWTFYNKLSAIREKRFNTCINKSTVMCAIEYTISTQRSTDSLKGILDDNLLFYYYTVKSFCWRKYILNVFPNLVSSSLLLGEW